MTPGRYVGAEAIADDGEAFGERMERLVTTLGEQMRASIHLDEQIRTNLSGLGYPFRGEMGG